MFDTSRETNARRLDSWKEIAAYFGKDVRTVRRWEAQRGLPVHRFPGSARAGVFAFADELDRWLSDSPGRHEDSRAVAAAEPATLPDPALRPQASTGEAGLEPAAAGTLLHRLPPRWVAVVLLMFFVATGGVIVGLRRAGRPVMSPVARHTAEVDARTRDLCLRARYLWNLRTEDSLTQAAQLYDQATKLSPGYGPAYAGLADSYLLLRQYGKMPDADAYPKAYAASRKALELDEGLAEAHEAYGFVLNFWTWNFPEAEKEFRRAIELDPRDAQSHHWYATSLLSVGRYQDALKQIDQARQLKPDSVAILANRGYILEFIDPNAALQALTEIERASPEFAYAHRYLALLRLDRKEYPQFLGEFGAYLEMQNRTAEAAAIHRAEDVLQSHGSEAMLETLARSYGELALERGSPDAMDAAMLFAHLQDRGRTLEFLNLSCARRESNFEAMGGSPEFLFLRGNPEFETLLKRSRTPLPAIGGPATTSVASWEGAPGERTM